MRLTLVLFMVLCAATAAAETKRVAVIVGNNAGNAEQTPLRYAETDAGKLARVLAELGGVAPEDLFLLQGRNLGMLNQTFAIANKRIAAYQQNPANRVIALFYFSGHSDGIALELGPDRLSFSQLRAWLSTTGADVRVALVDSCKSGALIATKGGAPGPAFQIRLADDLASTGEALLTSSAANEVALESREIGGSFFTHHLVSGLRGAADTSGDGTVTLTEAYQYAYAHTISTTDTTVIGPQHPAYDYRLSGQGELVLTELTRPSAQIELPAGFDRGLVIELARDQVIAELTSDAHPVIAVQPGRYSIRAWRAGKVFAGRFSVTAAAKRSIAWAELTAEGGVATAAKGSGSPPTVLRERIAVEIAVGGSGGIAESVGLVPSLRIGLVMPSGLSIVMTGASRDQGSFRETATYAFVGYRRGLRIGPVRGWLGLEGGGGAVVQSVTHGASAYTGAIAVAPTVGGAVRVSRGVALSLEAALTTALIRRDGTPTIVALPASWLGLLIDL